METQQIANFELSFNSAMHRLSLLFIIVLSLIAIMFAPSFRLALIIATVIIITALMLWWLIRKSHVVFTLSATHLQQHLYRGGWVVKWNNVSALGLCYYDYHGWQQPLPWIGIKLKRTAPYLNTICLNIVTNILLSQRSLLFLGSKQSGQSIIFEDIVLDSERHRTDEGEIYTGLTAMLANRMRYQRNYHGYDIFISTSDLSISGEEFIGMARRYWAAAEREMNQTQQLTADDHL
jgi:hypothetical protein